MSTKDSAELLSLVVTVHPDAACTVPTFLGSAIHALLIRWIAEHSPALAEHWDKAAGPKPYACSTLIGGQRISSAERLLTPDKRYWFRVVALNAEIAAVLRERLAKPSTSIELDGALLTIESMTIIASEHPWADSVRYEDLAAPYLLARLEAPRKVRLHFCSPVVFKQRDHDMPFPLPDLVFGSLVDRWNAFSPIALSPEMRRFCEASVRPHQFRLRSVALPVKGGLYVGSVGEVSYRAETYDRYWMGILGLLADYARFAGIGRMTTLGLGRTERLDARSGNGHFT